MGKGEGEEGQPQQEYVLPVFFVISLLPTRVKIQTSVLFIKIKIKTKTILFIHFYLKFVISIVQLNSLLFLLFH